MTFVLITILLILSPLLITNSQDEKAVEDSHDMNEHQIEVQTRGQDDNNDKNNNNNDNNNDTTINNKSNNNRNKMFTFTTPSPPPTASQMPNQNRFVFFS